MGPALRFEDVLAARMLARQEPRLRDRMLAHLDALAAGAARRSLLGTLVNEGLLPMDGARGVQEAVDRYRRGRGLGIFAELLSTAGLPADVVRGQARQVGPQVDIDSLGAALVAQGRVASSDEERLRFQARAALDRDLAQEVERYLQGRRPTGAMAAANAEELAPAGSAFFKPDVLLPSRQEARAIVAKNLTSTLTDLRGPRFRIPSWVDIADPMVGKLVHDRYRIVGRIGAGGNGTVYLCYREDAADRPLALKLLVRDARPNVIGRFKREALANSSFHHPSTLELDDAGVTKDRQHFLAMEFFDGQDLAKVLEERGPLPLRRGLLLARKVLEVLEAAHAAAIVHRDIKPENILVSADLERIKLMDFGIALLGSLGEFKDRVFHTVGPDIVGTPRYMSPEQAASEVIGPPSDLFSLGLVLYEMVTGAFPYEADGPLGYLACHITEDPLPMARVHPEAAGWPPAVQDLLDRLMMKDSDDRPQTARAVIDVIDAILVRLAPEDDPVAQ